MNELMTPLTLFIAGIASLWVVLAPREKVLNRAIFVAVIMFALIPTFGPASWVAAVPVAMSTIVVAFALARDPRPVRITWGLVAICAFIMVNGAAQFQSENLASIGLILAQILCFSLIAAACSVRPSDSGHPVFSALLVLLPLELVIAALEQARLVPVIWARDETAQYRDITLRFNELAPSLLGRSMGTFAHPILLGSFAALMTVLCLIVAFRTRLLRYYAAAAAATLTVILSGTRSAAVAVIVAVLLYLMLAPGKAQVVRSILGTLTVTVVLLNTQLIDRLLNADVQSSASYLHRTRILSSVPNLLARDDLALFFGSGAGSIDALFSQGVVTGFSTFRFFDNQYVRLLALSGVVSLVLFAGVVIRGLIIGNRASRVVLVVILIMMASFDTLTWGFAYLFTIIAVCGAVSLPQRPETPPPTSRQTPADAMKATA